MLSKSGYRRLKPKREPFLLPITPEMLNLSLGVNNIQFDQVFTGHLLYLPVTKEMYDHFRHLTFDGVILDHPNGQIEMASTSYGWQQRNGGDTRQANKVGGWCIVGSVTKVRHFVNEKDPTTDEVDLDLE